MGLDRNKFHCNLLNLNLLSVEQAYHGVKILVPGSRGMPQGAITAPWIFIGCQQAVSSTVARATKQRGQKPRVTYEFVDDVAVRQLQTAILTKNISQHQGLLQADEKWQANLA